MIREMNFADKLEYILEKCSSVDIGHIDVENKHSSYYMSAYFNKSEESFEAEELTVAECIDKIFEEVRNG